MTRRERQLRALQRRENEIKRHAPGTLKHDRAQADIDNLKRKLGVEHGRHA